MSTFAPGDVVVINRHAGLWVVMRRDDSLALAIRYHVVTDMAKVPLGLTVGEGDMEFHSRPTFGVNQVVKYHHAFDGKATVLADAGDVIRIRYMKQRRDSLGGEHELVTDACRGSLTGMNL
jgi:hypothetical protein